LLRLELEVDYQVAIIGWLQNQGATIHCVNYGGWYAPGFGDSYAYVKSGLPDLVFTWRGRLWVWELKFPRGQVYDLPQVSRYATNLTEAATGAVVCLVAPQMSRDLGLTWRPAPLVRVMRVNGEGPNVRALAAEEKRILRDWIRGRSEDEAKFLRALVAVRQPLAKVWPAGYGEVLANTERRLAEKLAEERAEWERRLNLPRWGML